MAGTDLNTGNRKRLGCRLGIRSCSITVLLAAMLNILPGTASADASRSPIVVTSDTDLGDLSPGDGSCETLEGKCSLRAAIQEANSDPDHDVIEFAGPMTIRVFQALPRVTGPATIDGGGNVVVQEGSWVGTDDVWVAQARGGLEFTAPAQVRDLTVKRFGNIGIRLEPGSDGSVVEGTRLEHNGVGISVRAPGVRVGSEGKPNYIVGGYTGVSVDGAGSRVEGNSFKGGYASGWGISVYAADVAVIGNDIEERGGGGVLVQDAARALVMDNRITGNRGTGIQAHRSDSTRIEGNTIQANDYGILSYDSNGLTIESNIVGGPGMGNARTGIWVKSPGARVAGNTVIGNGFGTEGGAGVVVAGEGVQLLRNEITGNRYSGIHVMGRGHVIGGPSSTDGNFVAGNGGDGISIIDAFGDTSADTGIVVENNRIGSTATGQPAGNGGDGILVRASHTQVIRNSIRSSGGHGVKVAPAGFFRATTNVLVQSNVVGGSGGGNQLAGIAVEKGELYGASGITLLSNSIVANGGLPIDLGADGRTENDPLDGDTGPNNLQNTPEVMSVKVTGPRVRATVRLDSTPLSAFTVELFASSACAAGGEPARSLGFVSMRTDESGSAVAEVNLKASLAGSDGIVATATSAGGDTSEVSACRAR